MIKISVPSNPNSHFSYHSLLSLTLLSLNQFKSCITASNYPSTKGQLVYAFRGARTERNDGLYLRPDSA